MIRVPRIEEPPRFQQQVREPGQRWLDQCLRPWAQGGCQPPQPDFPPYWTHAVAVLAPTLWPLKVTLEDTDPPIWRRLVVPSSLTLVELHAVLQLAMGWTNSHLHAFKVGQARFELPAPEPGWALDESNAEDERLARLSEVVTGPKARFAYEYDFGDGWEHQIVLEKTVAAEPGAVYPRVVDGALACPPEDVGGVGGYYEFLAAMADRRHPRHKELREWHRAPFAAEAFDAAPSNRCLDALFHPPAR